MIINMNKNNDEWEQVEISKPANRPARNLAMFLWREDDSPRIKYETLRISEAPDELWHNKQKWYYCGTSDGIAIYQLVDNSKPVHD